MALPFHDEESAGRRLIGLGLACGRRGLRLGGIAAPPGKDPHLPPAYRGIGRQSDVRFPHQLESQPGQGIADSIGQLSLELRRELEQKLDVRGMHAERILIWGVYLAMLGPFRGVSHFLREMRGDSRGRERDVTPAAENALQKKANLTVEVLQLLQHTRIIRYGARRTRGTQGLYFAPWRHRALKRSSIPQIGPYAPRAPASKSCWRTRLAACSASSEPSPEREKRRPGGSRSRAPTPNRSLSPGSTNCSTGWRPSGGPLAECGSPLGPTNAWPPRSRGGGSSPGGTPPNTGPPP